MKAKLLSLALFTAGLIGPFAPTLADAAPPAARSQAIATPDPAKQIKDLGRLFRASDVAGLVQALVPPSKWEEVRLVYELKRLEPTSEEDRAEFAEKIARFTAPTAVDDLMAEIEPKLVEARPQAGGALLVAFGALQMAANSPDSHLTAEQRTALQAALPGFQYWASGTDFLSSQTLRQALTLMTDAARRTGITDLDQLKALPLEGVLDRASGVLVAAKDAVRLYGLDVDAIVDSLQVEVLEIGAETARVRTTITLFDAPLWHDHDLELIEGRWYPKGSVEHFKSHHAAQVN